MISGISGNNSFYSYQSAINNMRLGQILSKNTSAVSKVSAANRVSSYYGSNTASSIMADSISYVNKYSSSMTDLMNSSNALRDVNGSSPLNQLTSSSSDATVASVTSRYRLYGKEETYSLDVSQLAAAQTNVSDGVTSGVAASGDINMDITMNNGQSVSIAVSAQNDNGTMKTNQKLLSDTAAAINQSDIGVRASVVTNDDGKISLQLTSKETGAANGFSVTGDYAAAGGMANMQKSAQDAVYSVTKDGQTISRTSASNKIDVGYGKMDVTLKKTGTADLTIGMDSDKIVSAMEDFVKSYNNTVSLLSANADRGSGTVRQLNKMGFIPGAEGSMKQIGLSYDRDGALTLDKDALKKNLKEQPSLTKDAIGGSSGLGQRAFNAAQSGLTASANSLVNNDMSQAMYADATSSFNFMNSYSRAGAYNNMNYYAVGMMLNMFA